MAVPLAEYAHRSEGVMQMAIPIGTGVGDVIRQTGLSKAAGGVSATLSHCDIGVAGAKAVTVGLFPFSGFNLGSLGLGLGLGSWGPLLVLAAGAAGIAGYSQYRKHKLARRRRARSAGLKGVLKSIFAPPPSPQVHKKKRVFSLLGFSVWH